MQREYNITHRANARSRTHRSNCIRVFQSKVHELLATYDTCSNHRKCRAYGAHTTIENKSSTQWICSFDNAKVSIQVIVLVIFDMRSCDTKKNVFTSIGRSGEIGILSQIHK